MTTTFGSAATISGTATVIQPSRGSISPIRAFASSPRFWAVDFSVKLFDVEVIRAASSTMDRYVSQARASRPIFR